jgi:hypothetical protein
MVPAFARFRGDDTENMEVFTANSDSSHPHAPETTKPAIVSPALHLRNSSVDQTAVLIHCCSFCFGAAPTWREAISPPLKIISVGIDITP